MKKKAVKKPLKRKMKPAKKPLKKKPAKKRSVKMAAAPTGTHPPRTCPFCQYYPCYYDAVTGSYRCPRCGKTF